MVHDEPDGLSCGALKYHDDSHGYRDVASNSEDDHQNAILPLWLRPPRVDGVEPTILQPNQSPGPGDRVLHCLHRRRRVRGSPRPRHAPYCKTLTSCRRFRPLLQGSPSTRIISIQCFQNFERFLITLIILSYSFNLRMISWRSGFCRRKYLIRSWRGVSYLYHQCFIKTCSSHFSCTS